MDSRSDNLVWIVLTGSVAVLGTVFIFQYGVGLAPCPLCLYQRWPYYAALVLTISALFVRREGLSPVWRQAAMGLTVLGFAAGTALAVYHVGVEQHWWAGPSTCSGTPITGRTLDDLRAQLLATPVVRCDRVAWSLLGVSMAGYNIVASSTLAVLSALALRAPIR